MKSVTLALIALALAVFTAPALAQDGGGAEPNSKQSPKPAPDRDKIPTKDEIRKKYDENGDGRLDEAERAKARSELGRRRGPRRPTREELLERFDENGDGTLDEAEREKARARMKDRRGKRAGPGGPNGDGERRRPSPGKILEEFDENGDGKLDEAEREKARAEMEKRRGERAGPGGDGERRRPSPEEIRKKYDEDGDGKLDEAERKKAREEMEKRRKEREGEGRRGGRRGGAGGRKGRQRPSREEILKKYDLDGDGQLNEEERAKIREDMEKRRGEDGGRGRGKGGGKGGRRGGGGGGR